MKYDILSAGVSLVELPRKQFDVPFDEVGEFVGPFASGDTCIMLDTAARLGAKCCWLGAFGEDVFSRVVRNRLASDGVDISHALVSPEYTTRPVFVRYNSDGSREYYTMRDTPGTAAFDESFVDAEVVANAKWVHFSGEIITLFANSPKREGLLKLLNSITAEQKVSLDPNDGWSVEDIDTVMKPFVDRADLILPSEGEAKNLLRTATDEEACKQWAAQGKLVALKRGKHGCDIYSGDEVIHADAYTITEVDPTGCGDSFCAGFVTGLVEGMPLAQVGRFANACGALQATAMGPMEGSMPRAEVERFMRENG